MIENNLYDRLAPGRPKSEYTDEILQLRKRGFSYGQIALKFAVPRSTVSTICQREWSCVICDPMPCKGKHNII